eukprot:7760576-Pyramimonas_sp.AAC.1
MQRPVAACGFCGPSPGTAGHQQTARDERPMSWHLEDAGSPEFVGVLGRFGGASLGALRCSDILA